MNELEILATLIDIFKSCSEDSAIDYSTITMETGLFDELAISSISAIYMALEIESRFGISLTNEDTASLKRVGDLVLLIKEKGK